MLELVQKYFLFAPLLPLSIYTYFCFAQSMKRLQCDATVHSYRNNGDGFEPDEVVLLKTPFGETLRMGNDGARAYGMGSKMFVPGQTVRVSRGLIFRNRAALPRSKKSFWLAAMLIVTYLIFAALVI